MYVISIFLRSLRVYESRAIELECNSLNGSTFADVFKKLVEREFSMICILYTYLWYKISHFTCLRGDFFSRSTYVNIFMFTVAANRRHEKLTVYYNFYCEEWKTELFERTWWEVELRKVKRNTETRKSQLSSSSLKRNPRNYSRHFFPFLFWFFFTWLKEVMTVCTSFTSYFRYWGEQFCVRTHRYNIEFAHRLLWSYKGNPRSVWLLKQIVHPPGSWVSF